MPCESTPRRLVSTSMPVTVAAASPSSPARSNSVWIHGSSAAAGTVTMRRDYPGRMRVTRPRRSPNAIRPFLKYAPHWPRAALSTR